MLVPCDLCSRLLSTLVIRGFEAVPVHRVSVNPANPRLYYVQDYANTYGDLQYYIKEYIYMRKVLGILN